MPIAYQDRLTDLIYAAMLGEVPWQAFVDEIGQGLPGGRTTLFFHDPGRGSGRYLLTSNMDPGDVRAYNETYAPLNPWMPGAARRPVGLGVVAEQMLDPSVLRRSILYNDYLKPLDCHSATGITIERTDGRLFLLSVLTSRPDPEANLGHAQTLTAIGPHLRRAFRHMRQHDQQGRSWQAAMDALGVGVVVIGPGGVARRVSELASELMGRSRSLTFDRRGRLQFTDGDLAGAVAAMLHRDTPPARVHEQILIHDGCALRVIVVRIVADALSEALQGPTVLVLLDPLTGEHNGTRPDLRALSGLALHYRLTPAETEVLQALASGLTLDQISRLRDVTRETVKAQVRSLFTKTGTRRQADLVRLVLTLRSSTR